MILLREKKDWRYITPTWRPILDAISFHPIPFIPNLNDGRVHGDLLLEFLDRHSGLAYNKWTKYRLHFDPNDVLRLEHVIELNYLEGLKKYGDK